MSIFGQLDAATISSNPYWIEKGDYTAEVTKGEYRTNKDNKRQLFFEYTITDEDSQYHDQRVSQFLTLVDPDLTAEALALMPADDQKSIRRTNSLVKRTLCGNDANSSQKGLGVSIEELNDPNWNPSSLIGTKVVINIDNYGTNNQGVNLKWVNLAE